MNLLRYFLAGLALLGACASGLFGVAALLFQQGDRRSVEIAARLVPFNPAYLSRLSGFYPVRRTGLLQQAVELNPHSEQAWLQLGFDAEFHHADYASAEKYYLRSAQVSRLFLPRWTLANFYFRRQNTPEFLKWANSALAITPYPADPIFTEMWLMDPARSRLAADVPNRPAILEQYLTFLMNAGQFPSVPPVLERLVRSANSADAHLYGLTGVIGPALDRLLAHGYPSEAIRAWGAISAAHWIPFPTPNANRPLTNGGFEPLFAHGFDWILMHNDGASITPSTAAHEIEIELSGDQPESCTLLSQWIPLGPNRHYSLQWKADFSGLSNPAGLNWRVHADALNLLSADLLAPHPAPWDFQTPADTHLAVLTLEYKRPPGETRAQGSVALHAVSLQPE